MRLVLGLLLAASLAAQSTLHVDAAAPGPGSGTMFDPFPTIGAALAVAVSGDTIALVAGTYSGPGNRDLDLSGKAVTITGRAGAAATVIDCGGSAGSPHRAFLITAGTASPTLQGLTVQNGHASTGGGLRVAANVGPVLQDCVFSACTATAEGGAIWIISNVPSAITGCTFDGNAGGTMGGAIYVQGAQNDPVLSGCTFTGNQAAEGGAMAFWDCQGSLDGCTFDQNTATLRGGGLFTINAGNPAVTGCQFTGNTATSQGGAVANISASNPVFDACTFATNSAADGGAFYSENQSDPTVRACTFDGNVATLGGAVHHVPGSTRGRFEACTFTANSAASGGGLSVWGTAPVITGCSFVQNVSTGDGGGLYCINGGDPVVSDCVFDGNTATLNGGGASAVSASHPRFERCSFIGNQVTANGGGLYSNNQSRPEAIDCGFEGNGAGFGGGAYVTGSTGTSRFAGCHFTANTALVGGGGFTAWDDAPLLERCRFVGNGTPGNGGGLLAINLGSPTLVSCLFHQNTAQSGAGLAVISVSTASVLNATIAANLATGQGGGVFAVNQSAVTLTNCIVRTNGAPASPDVHGMVSGTYNDVQGGLAGVGNVDLPAGFVSPATFDFRLAAGSPCIDAGDNGALPATATLDLDGSVRRWDVVATPDTGVGPAPVVDLGAFESVHGAGQANGINARLEIQGVGGGFAQGPFPATVTSGGTLTLDWAGPPGGSLILVAGPLAAPGIPFPCVGSLDVGTPPFFTDLVIVFDGTLPPWSTFFTLGPAGTATQSFSLPALPSGPLLSLQGLVLQPSGLPCAVVLTAAFSLFVE